MFACKPVAEFDLSALYVNSVRRRSAAVLGCTESVAMSQGYNAELKARHKLRNSTAKKAT